MKEVKWLSERWAKTGLGEGDMVMLHSSVLRTLALMKRNGLTPSVDFILDSFLRVLGKEGTLILPLFNFDFTSGTTFDFHHTPSHMGVLTETARKRMLGVRTGHPIYSFLVIGKYSLIFEGLNNYSGYGGDSPFALLRKMNGKIAILDLKDGECMTFHHHVEEMNKVPYRYFKDFFGDYIDKDGIISRRKYSIYVRDLDKGVITLLNPVGELLWKNNIYIGDRPLYDSGLRFADSNKIFNFVTKIIEDGKAFGNLYGLDKT